jgi:hypothetical protein
MNMQRVQLEPLSKFGRGLENLCRRWKMSFIRDDTSEQARAGLALMEAGVESRPLNGKGSPREPSSKQSIKSRLRRHKPEVRKSTRDFIFLMTGAACVCPAPTEKRCDLLPPKLSGRPRDWIGGIV